MTAKERMDALVEAIRNHNDAYFVRGDPQISDEEYDRLYQELEELEELCPDLRRHDSPTRTVENEENHRIVGELLR